MDVTRRYETKNIEQKVQLENKELELKTVLSELRNQKEEIKGLKTKVDDLTKEGQILKDCGKSKTYVEKLEGTSEIISNLKIQIEEAKTFEEVMKTQLNDKENFCQKLKLELEKVKSEDGSTCITGSETKKIYVGALKDTFTKNGEMKAVDYPQFKHISPYKVNEKSNLYNSSPILDEILSK